MIEPWLSPNHYERPMYQYRITAEVRIVVTARNEQSAKTLAAMFLAAGTDDRDLQDQVILNGADVRCCTREEADPR